LQTKGHEFVLYEIGRAKVIQVLKNSNSEMSTDNLPQFICTGVSMMCTEIKENYITDKLQNSTKNVLSFERTKVYKFSLVNINTTLSHAWNPILNSIYKEKSTVFKYAALSSCTGLLCMVSILFFLCRFDVARSGLRSLPCRYSWLLHFTLEKRRGTFSDSVFVV
jgi:hypothetical protein